jgi:prepilin-type N-terminal cleavage/methylation domain-containing protein
MDVLNHKNRQSQSGFSLMETLLALAIMSVASLALFQSTAALLRLSNRTVEAALRSQDVAVIQKSFAALVKGLVPAWPKDTANTFRGDSTGFSGLTRMPFHTLEVSLMPFSLSLENNGSTSSLIYRSGKVEWVLKTFSGAGAYFSYLGEDNVWRRSWPPKNTPEPGQFGDAQFYDPPTFPLAIQLRAPGVNPDTGIVWIAYIGYREELPNLEEFSG